MSMAILSRNIFRYKTTSYIYILISFSQIWCGDITLYVFKVNQNAVGCGFINLVHK